MTMRTTRRGVRIMQRILATITAGLAIACGAPADSGSGSAQQVEQEGARSAAEAAAEALEPGTMRIQGLSELELARLRNWQGMIELLEGPDGAADTMELSFSAQDDEDEMEASIHLVRLVRPGTPLPIDGRHEFQDPSTLGRRDQLNLRVRDARYSSVSGHVTLDHRGGALRGSFDAHVARIDDATAPAVRVRGQFAGELGVGCHALQDTTPDPSSTEGGELADESETGAVGPTWTSVHLTHEFCLSYF